MTSIFTEDSDHLMGSFSFELFRAAFLSTWANANTADIFQMVWISLMAHQRASQHDDSAVVGQS